MEKNISLHHRTGFTLIEILVALAILAGSFLALVKIGGGYTRQVAYLSDKTCAHWVAEDNLTEASLKEWPALGKSEGFAKMGAQDWYWEKKVLETSDPALRRLEVSVRSKKKEGSNFLVTLVGFAGESQNKKKVLGP